MTLIGLYGRWEEILPEIVTRWLPGSCDYWNITWVGIEQVGMLVTAPIV